MQTNNSKVPELLKDKARVFELKGKQYVHTYKTFGDVWKALFPNGYTVTTVEQANIFGIYHMLIHKIIRLAGKLHLPSEISIDSAQDLQVYGAMLEELISEAQEKKEKSNC